MANGDPGNCNQCAMYDSEIAKAWALTSKLQAQSDKNYRDLIEARIRIEQLETNANKGLVTLVNFPTFDIIVKSRD